MIRYVATYISFFIILLSIFSCVTENTVTPHSADYDIEDKSPEEIFEEFLSVNPIEAITIAQQFLRRNLISAEQIQHFTQRALEQAQKNVQKFYDVEDYEQAWIAAENARIAGKNISKQLLYNILVKRVEYFVEKNNYPAIITTVNKIEKIASKKIKNLATFTKMLDERRKAQAFFSPLTRKKAAFSMKDLRESTFIVDINNGIQIASDGSGPRIARGIGSAFFITNNGYAITNKHVISTEVDPEYEGLSEMKARLSADNFTTRPSYVVGYDSVLDLALIKVPFSPSYVFPLHSSKSEVGDTAIAIGSPLGLTNTVTSGIISGKDRTGILSRSGVFQIDASINSGNSGGPVVDENKNLVGVAFSKISEVNDRVFEGLNFVIPSEMIRMVLPRLFEGKVEHSWLGIGVFKVEEGLEVAYIHPNSRISRSALRIGDIITHINDTEVSKVLDAQKLLLPNVPNMLYSLRVLSSNNKTTQVQFLLRPSEKIYEEAEKREKDIQNNKQTEEKKYEVQNILVQSTTLEKEIIKPQSKATLHTVFSILTGTQITVTRYSNFRPMYRITHVYPDTLAEYIRLSIGDLIAIRSIRQHENIIQVAIQILQQSRGYLESTIIVTIPVSAENFI